jgi:hypothetical protein
VNHIKITSADLARFIGGVEFAPEALGTQLQAVRSKADRRGGMLITEDGEVYIKQCDLTVPARTVRARLNMLAQLIELDEFKLPAIVDPVAFAQTCGGSLLRPKSPLTDKQYARFMLGCSPDAAHLDAAPADAVVARLRGAAKCLA